MSDVLDADTVAAQQSEGNLTLTLRHPGKRNALSGRMYEMLAAHLNDAAKDESITAVVIQGGGDDGFAAGTDISTFTDFTGADGLAYERNVGSVLRAIQELPMPTIAVVRGAAVGAGLAIVASCDIVIAERGASFGAPIVRTLGNCLPAEVINRLMSRMGTATTIAMLLTATLVPASQLYASGFIYRLTEEEELDEAVASITRGISRSAPLSLRALKETVKRVENREEVPSNDDLLELCYGSVDFKEGVRSFLAGKRPNWKGI